MSFGSPPGGAVGFGAFNGALGIGPDGRPNGSGQGDFDLTLSNTAPLSTSPNANQNDVESLVLHELGHALGLRHPDSNTDAVMWGESTSGAMKRSLTTADRAGHAVMYPSANSGGLCQGLAITIDLNTGAPGVGTAGNDVISGTPGADTIDAGDGNDVVCAGGGADTVIGGNGDDRILGEGGNDLLRGGPGVDVIDGGEGDDRVLGGIGDDTLIGGEGSGAGNNHINGDSATTDCETIFGTP